jgi:hypothetical protein
VGFPWGSVAQRWVKPFGIVTELDLSGHVLAGVFPSWVHSPVHLLDFERGVERSCERIIKT